MHVQFENSCDNGKNAFSISKFIQKKPKMKKRRQKILGVYEHFFNEIKKK